MHQLLWIIPLLTLPEAVPLLQSWNHADGKVQSSPQDTAVGEGKHGGSIRNGEKYEEQQLDNGNIKKHHDDKAKGSKNEEEQQKRDTEKKKVAPLEHLPAKAYGEPGEKWKVLGYSETTGYPIIDLSELGINNEKENSRYIPVPSPAKSETEPENKQKPLTYSEMKGGHMLKKPTQNSEKSKKHADFLKNLSIFEKHYDPKYSPSTPDGKNNKKIDRISKNLHSKLHRTHMSKDETVRSILYPMKKPHKYRVESRRRRMQQFLDTRRKPDPKGKYDIRHFDLEKLMDIVVSDAAVLTLKYIRDIPSLPLIYNCKVDIMFRLFKILGGFQSMVRFHGKKPTETGDTARPWLSELFENLGKTIFRWILGIKPTKPPIEGVARTLEHDLMMFQGDLPHLTDRECEGEMDERDWDNFNFHYNSLLDMGKRPERRRFLGRLTNKVKARIGLNKKTGEKVN